MSDKTIDNSGSTPGTEDISKGFPSAETKAAASAKKPAKKAKAKAGAKPDHAGAAAVSEPNLKASDKKLAWVVVDKIDDIPSTGLSVTHNGNGYTIPVGEPTQVEEFLLGVIDASRFSYSRVSAPSAKEQKAAQ